MKHKHLAAIVAALALGLPSCGGDDSPDKPAAAAGTSSTAQTEQPESDSTPAAPDDSSSSKKTKNGDGGSSAADAERAAAEGGSPSPSNGDSNSGGGQRKQAAPKTAAGALADLSPSERRHLHRDLFEQGKNLCYVYGPEELARSYNLPSSDPETLARLLAREYEKATPTLILPYQQGCLAGLRKFERNPPKD